MEDVNVGALTQVGNLKQGDLLVILTNASIWCI